ncbi:MAG: hypothetical protein JNK05_01615 [Myxococcales bacterium]|nr:hypothetical protein [Myxococcales bacterium]
MIQTLNVTHKPVPRPLACLAVPLAVATSLFPSTSLAQQPAPAVSAASPTDAVATTTATRPSSLVRLRLGVGAQVSCWGIGQDWPSVGVGGYVRVGAQLTERVGLDAQFAGTAGTGWAVHGAVIAEFAPTDQFALGSGMSIVRLHNTAAFLLSRYEANITFVGIPLRAAFHPTVRSREGVRNAFEILIEADFGVGSRSWPAAGPYCFLLCSSSTTIRPAGSRLDFGFALWLGVGYARF